LLVSLPSEPPQPTTAVPTLTPIPASARRRVIPLGLSIGAFLQVARPSACLFLQGEPRVKPAGQAKRRGSLWRAATPIQGRSSSREVQAPLKTALGSRHERPTKWTACGAP